MSERVKLTNRDVWVEMECGQIYVYHKEDCPSDEPYEIIQFHK